MTSRPCLVYTPVPHPPPRPATSPTASAAAGETAIAPIVTYADPDPPPASTTGKPWLRGFVWTVPRSAGATLLALTLAVVLLAAAHYSGHHPGADTPAGSGGAAPSGGVARPVPLRSHHGSRLGPIRLPNPLGDAQRTIPLETIWIVDKTLPRADVAVVSQETPVDVSYLTDHSLPDDQLGFALQPRSLEWLRTHETRLTATVAHPARILVAEPSQPIHLPPVTPGYDRAIVIITANAAPWLKNLPTSLTPPAPTTRSRPGQNRTYILNLLPHSGPQADPLTRSSIQPQQLTADPLIRGALALTLARAFVDATGAMWP